MSQAVERVNNHYAANLKPSTQYKFDNELGILITVQQFEDRNKESLPEQLKNTASNLGVNNIKENINVERFIPKFYIPIPEVKSTTFNVQSTTSRLSSAVHKITKICKTKKSCKCICSGVHVCKLCFKCFDLKSTYNQHLKIHNSEYVCVFCNKNLNKINSFSDKQLFITHLMIHIDSSFGTK